MCTSALVGTDFHSAEHMLGVQCQAARRCFTSWGTPGLSPTAAASHPALTSRERELYTQPGEICLELQG